VPGTRCGARPSYASRGQSPSFSVPEFLACTGAGVPTRRTFGDSWVQAADGDAQASRQDDFGKRISLGVWFTGCKISSVPDGVVELFEPFERGVFDGGFVEGHGRFKDCCLPKSPAHPGWRFALPWAISLCPVGANDPVTDRC
jgi:hypothetical protein